MWIKNEFLQEFNLNEIQVRKPLMEKIKQLEYELWETKQNTKNLMMQSEINTKEIQALKMKLSELNVKRSCS